MHPNCARLRIQPFARCSKNLAKVNRVKPQSSQYYCFDRKNPIFNSYIELVQHFEGVEFCRCLGAMHLRGWELGENCEAVSHVGKGDEAGPTRYVEGTFTLCTVFTGIPKSSVMDFTCSRSFTWFLFLYVHWLFLLIGCVLVEILSTYLLQGWIHYNLAITASFGGKLQTTMLRRFRV